MFFISYLLTSIHIIQEGLINTANITKQLQDEDNDGVSKLSSRLPPHPGKPDKEQHKKGIIMLKSRATCQVLLFERINDDRDGS